MIIVYRVACHFFGRPINIKGKTIKNIYIKALFNRKTIVVIFLFLLICSYPAIIAGFGKKGSLLFLYPIYKGGNISETSLFRLFPLCFIIKEVLPSRGSYQGAVIIRYYKKKDYFRAIHGASLLFIFFYSLAYFLIFNVMMALFQRGNMDFYEGVAEAYVTFFSISFEKMAMAGGLLSFFELALFLNLLFFFTGLFKSRIRGFFIIIVFTLVSSILVTGPYKLMTFSSYDNMVFFGETFSIAFMKMGSILLILNFAVDLINRKLLIDRYFEF